MNKTCPVCQKDLSTGPVGGIGRVWFCGEHYREASQVRLKRMDRDLAKREDILLKRNREMKEATEERDRVRRCVEEEKAKIRAEVEAAIKDEVVGRIRRLPFWARLRLLFNPFSNHIPGDD